MVLLPPARHAGGQLGRAALRARHRVAGAVDAIQRHDDCVTAGTAGGGFARRRRRRSWHERRARRGEVRRREAQVRADAQVDVEAGAGVRVGEREREPDAPELREIAEGARRALEVDPVARGMRAGRTDDDETASARTKEEAAGFACGRP